MMSDTDKRELLLRYGYGARGTPFRSMIETSKHRCATEIPLMDRVNMARTERRAVANAYTQQFGGCNTHTTPPLFEFMEMLETTGRRHEKDQFLQNISEDFLRRLSENNKTDDCDAPPTMDDNGLGNISGIDPAPAAEPGQRAMGIYGLLGNMAERIFGKLQNRSLRMGKNNNEKRDDVINVEDLIAMFGRRSGLRRMFYKNIDNMTNLAVGIVADTFHEFAENNLYSTLLVYGHYDTFISKSSVKVLLRYLWPKYGKHILMDVDGNFSMCSISIEKIKKAVLGFPELVNKTIRPGIYWVKLSDVGKGTYMIVVKHKLYSESDISENGIRAQTKNFKTSIIFLGKQKNAWRERIQREIDGFCSGLVTTSSSSDKIRVQSLGGGENVQNDIIIRPMQNLVFPQKESILKRIQSFLDSGKIYKENGIPYRKGYLFHGPRGTGKTAFAFSLANHFQMECVSVDLSYFDTNGGANAFNGSNTIYIIDEIDAQLPKSRVAETHEAVTVDQQKIIDRLHKLLKAMDDMSEGSIIIATTNFPDRLDPAIVRSGRFDEKVEFVNLDKKYATMMCTIRGLDPEKLLANEKFPINPAYLEQKCIEALLEKNNIVQKELKSAEEIVLEEYGVDVSETTEPDVVDGGLPCGYVNPDTAAALEEEEDDAENATGETDNAEERIETIVSEKDDARMVIDDDEEDENVLEEEDDAENATGETDK